MAKLFLDGIFKMQGQGNDSSSAVYITIPNPSSKSAEATTSLVGLMIGDPTWNASNKWGPVINDISNLSDISSLVGSSSMFSWINASTMCWKGTDPLSIGIEFYLINYEKGLELESKLRSFVKLASLYKDPDATGGKNYKVLVHGGYAADVLSGNQKFFSASVKKASDLGGDFNDLGEGNSNLYSNGYAKGAVQLRFGHKSAIKNLLLQKVSVTESTIEVADQNGKNIKPLYYRVNAQFVGVKPLVTTDVDDMFKGG